MNFIEEAPGPLVYNQEELINSIKNVNEVEKSFRKKYENFKNKYTEFESGNSAKVIIEKFFK